MRNQSIFTQGLQLFVASVGAFGILLLFGIVAGNTGLAAMGLVLVMTAIVGQMAISFCGDSANMFGHSSEIKPGAKVLTATFKKVS